MTQVAAPTLTGKTLTQARAEVDSARLSLKVTGMRSGQGSDTIGLRELRMSGDQEVGLKIGGGTTSPFLAQLVTISVQSVSPGEMVDEGGEIGVIIYNPYEGRDKKSERAAQR
jgi:hypothetical protein